MSALGDMIRDYETLIKQQQKEIEQLKEELFIGHSNHFQCAPCLAGELQDAKIEHYEEVLKKIATYENWIGDEWLDKRIQGIGFTAQEALDKFK